MPLANDLDRAPGCETADAPFRPRRGTGALTNVELLALIARRGDPKRCAAPIAAALLGRFGCLTRMFGASVAELRQAAPADVAVDLALVAEIARRVCQLELHAASPPDASRALRRYLRAMLAGRSREAFRVLFLDAMHHLIADELMAEGTVDHAPVYPREVMRRALELSAAACLLAHNHPTGDPTPSAADIDMTRQVIAAGRAVGVAVLDHFIVAGDQVVSLQALGLL